MYIVYIDADACAVKEEVYKVCARYQWRVVVVANQYLSVPRDANIEMQVVTGNFDAADDWIVENISRGDILITSDLLLADRAIKKQAKVLGPKGAQLNEENIGSILASRELNSHLRNLGQMGTGPSAMTKKDRSQFLASLDVLINKIKKKK